MLRVSERGERNGVTNGYGLEAYVFFMVGGIGWKRFRRFCYERHCVYCGDDCFYRPGDFVFEGLRKAEVKVAGMIGNILLIVISILLCGYLLYALLKPENF
jgi:K+-transporting ATPase KdpF subunit